MRQRKGPRELIVLRGEVRERQRGGGLRDCQSPAKLISSGRGADRFCGLRGYPCCGFETVAREIQERRSVFAEKAAPRSGLRRLRGEQDRNGSSMTGFALQVNGRAVILGNVLDDGKP